MAQTKDFVFSQNTKHSVTLSNCDKEPIHMLGYVQSHAFLFVIEKSSKIIALSKNVGTFLGFEPLSLIGKSIKDLVPDFKCSVEELESRLPSPQGINRVFQTEILTSNGTFLSSSMYCHLNPQGHIIAEFCTLGVKDSGDFSQEFSQTVNHIFEKFPEYEDQTQEKILQLIVDEIRHVGNFDRVMVYQFDDEWNGTVIIEKTDLQGRFLGLRFPASDIPSQARKLYTLNRVRALADVNGIPSVILPEEVPIDLSLAIARSVSPIHIKYLKNMDVAATLTISLLLGADRTLWGMVVCHNYTPKPTSFHHIKFYDVLGRMASIQLENMLQRNKVELSLIQEREKARFKERFSEVKSIVSPAEKISPFLREIMNLLTCDGIYIQLNGEVVKDGSLGAALPMIISWIMQNTKGTAFYTHSVSDTMKIDCPDGKSCGVLYLPLLNEKFALLSRDELVQKVYWAGKTEKEEKNGVLQPRVSFDSYLELVKGKTPKWTKQHLLDAKFIQETLVTFLLKWNLEKAKKKAKVERENAENLLREQEIMVKTTELKNNFLSNITHELRTPIHAILANSEYMSMSMDKSSELAQCATAIQSSSEHLLSIINNILDFSKLEANKIELNNTPFSLLKKIEELMDTLHAVVQEKKLYLLMLMPVNLPSILVADSTRLGQILLNFISNALKFTHEGGVTVRISLAKQEGSQIRLRFDVQDTGIGIPEDKISKLFQRFVQLDISLSRAYEGTGLGLSISKQLTQLMGGEINVSSKVGEGSCFSVILPFETVQTPFLSPARALDADVGGLKGCRALILEERPYVKSFLYHYLRQWEVEITENIEECRTSSARLSYIFVGDDIIQQQGKNLLANLHALPSKPSVFLILNLWEKHPPFGFSRENFDGTLFSPLKLSELMVLLSGKREQLTQQQEQIPVPQMRLKVLLVEDNEANQRIGLRLLQKLGHDVEIAANGALALEALEKNKFDVILMDIMMPVMDGLTATAKIRHKERLYNLPPNYIIGVTASSGREKTECMNVGMDACLFKPFKLEALSLVLDAAYVTL